MCQISSHLRILCGSFLELPIEDCIWMSLLNPEGPSQHFELHLTCICHIIANLEFVMVCHLPLSCSVFFCKAVGGGIYYFLRKKFENKVRKKFGGHQSSKCWFEKVRWTPKFEMLVRKKFGGPNCSARVRKQSSKKVRWKESSKCWFQKSSGGQIALPELENKVRKSSVEKKFEMLVRKKFGGPNCSARVRKQS